MSVSAKEPDAAALAQQYGKRHPVFMADRDQPIIAEAEEFRVHQPDALGWMARNWGTNYYVGTFSNTFLSRKAYLSAPEQCDECVASRRVLVPQAGRYVVLVRYEAAYRFETQFRVQVEQHDRVLFARQYGARENTKIWAYGFGLKTEVAWPWGAVENMVWEGHDAFVYLQPGIATISLIATTQPEDAARRNIDLVLLTMDIEDVEKRIQKEKYLPLDGLLTQAGDVFVRVRNHREDSMLVLSIPPGTEHSPYWTHMRRWKKKKLLLEPGKRTDWLEVGSLLDTLNDGQWKVKAKGYPALDYEVEIGIKRNGKISRVRQFRGTRENLFLAYDANSRYTRRIRLQDEILFDLVNYLKEIPVRGKRPTQTLVYAHTFDQQPDHEPYMKARAEFIEMMGITSVNDQNLTPESPPVGYIDVRRLKGEKLEAYLQDLKSKKINNNIAVVSLGDEIKLPSPSSEVHEEFQVWLQEQGLKPSDIVSGAGDNWQKIVYKPEDNSEPKLYYYAQKYGHAYGIATMKARTDLIRRYLPNAEIGANFSPHHGHFYLGETHKWITLFRQGGMTMPWSEDYIWQVPVGSPQMSMLLLDKFRAGLQGKRKAKIHYYVMPHWPGNTPEMWRRQFYGALGHGMKIVNLFEFRPVQAAYTENHVSLPETYRDVRRALYELGTFEDIVQGGQVRRGKAGLWFSEVGDIWKNNDPPYGAAKRALYIGIRQQQVSLDIVTGEDALAGSLKRYRVLYLTDRNVSRAASEKIVQWVQAGGRLFATAGAGMFDEFNLPNAIMRELMGIDEIDIQPSQEGQIRLIKQDLPYVKAIDQVTWVRSDETVRFPIFGVKTNINVSHASVHGRFSNGKPALLIHKVGKGRVLYAGFLPSLTYFKPAIPKRVLDRGTTEQSMSHLLPTRFDQSVAPLIGMFAERAKSPAISQFPFVETNMISSKSGDVITLVNWSHDPIEGLKVVVNRKGDITDCRLASGEKLEMEQTHDQIKFTLNLDVADALVIR